MGAIWNVEPPKPKIKVPKYSIIIPAYNAEQTIEKAVMSVMRQSLKSFECIVVCDSCTDNTMSVAERCGARTAVSNARSDGPTRNVGIDISRGEWLMFLDADDWWLHEFVLEQVDEKLAETNPDVLCYGFIWRYLGFVPARSAKGTLYPHCTNKVWRKSFVGDTRFPDKYVANDAGFHELVMMKQPIIVEWDMPLYYYNYLRKGSKSDELGRTAEHTKLYWSTH